MTPQANVDVIKVCLEPDDEPPTVIDLRAALSELVRRKQYGTPKGQQLVISITTGWLVAENVVSDFMQQSREMANNFGVAIEELLYFQDDVCRGSHFEITVKF